MLKYILSNKKICWSVFWHGVKDWFDRPQWLNPNRHYFSSPFHEGMNNVEWLKELDDEEWFNSNA